MQSYREIELKQAKEVMEQDLAMVRFRGLVQNKPEVAVDKSYRLHQEQRKANKKVNLSFNRLAFSVKKQISVDRKSDIKGEKHGTME